MAFWSSYDYSEGLDRTAAPLTAAKLQAVNLEMDALNQHEIMATLVGLVQHMRENNITPSVATGDGGSPAVPAWVAAITAELTSTATHWNVKLFLAKLIINVEDSPVPYFHLFAAVLYAPLMDLLLGMDCAEGMNYFAVDVVHLLLQWSTKCSIPPENQSRAQKVFVFLLQHTMHSNSRVRRLEGMSWSELSLFPTAWNVIRA